MAAPKPVTLVPIYDDSVSSDLDVPKHTKSCSVTVTSIADLRRSPEMIGVYHTKAIHAPDDRDAWVRSVISALKSRRIDVRFADGQSAEIDGLKLEVGLTKAWIANTESNMSASVVFQVQATGASGQLLDLPYRGGASHTNWLGGAGELQRTIDTAFARSLDAMAADLHKLCLGET